MDISDPSGSGCRTRPAIDAEPTCMFQGVRFSSLGVVISCWVPSMSRKKIYPIADQIKNTIRKSREAAIPTDGSRPIAPSKAEKPSKRRGERL